LRDRVPAILRIAAIEAVSLQGTQGLSPNQTWRPAPTGRQHRSSEILRTAPDDLAYIFGVNLRLACVAGEADTSGGWEKNEDGA